MPEFSHFSPDGAVRMVDVGGKPSTRRLARAEGCVLMQPETLRLIRDRSVLKGDVLETARLAGILGAKQTPSLIPLCHSLLLESVSVRFSFPDEGTVLVEAEVSAEGRTGVEMEALTAVSTACLTIYDMAKSADRGMEISGIRLLEKTGGRSGHYLRGSEGA